MKLRLLVLLALLSLPGISAAQSTTVSGTVTDTPDNQTWNNGTLTAAFNPNPNYPGTVYTWTGGTLNQTISATLTSTGTYSVSVPSTSAITPGGSSWTFKFCPQAAPAQCFNVQSVTIAGGTQTVNATPPSIRINLPSTNPVSAYTPTEIVGAVIGSQYFNVTPPPSSLSGMNTCIALPCLSNWSSLSSGSALAGNSNAFYLSPVCPIPSSGNCFHINATGAFDGTVSASNGATTITLGPTPSRKFVQADVGTNVWAWNYNVIAATGANPVLELPLTTIATVAGNGLSATVASAGFTGNCTGGSAGGCIVFWGDTDESAAVNAWFTAVTTAPCGIGILPAGFIFVLSPIVNSSANCQGGLLTTTTYYGFGVVGQGIGGSEIIPMPAFNPSTCITNGPCIFGVPNTNGASRYDANYSVNCSGTPITGASNNFILILGGLAGTTQNVGVNGCGPSTGSLVGLQLSGATTSPANAVNVEVQNSGAVADLSFTGYVNCTECMAQGGNGVALTMAGTSGIFNTSLSEFGYASGTANVNVQGAGTVWNSSQDVISTPEHAGGGVENILVQNGSFAILSQDNIQAGGSTNNTGILNQSGGTIHLKQTKFTMAGTTNTGVNNAGSLFDDGGNIGLLTAPTPYTGAGTLFGSLSTTGTALVTGNIGLTSGWGTSSVATATGDSHRGRFTITGAAGAASPTLTLTFPTAYLVAPACTLFETGTSDFASLTNPTSATATTASVVFTFTGTPVAVTYQFDYQCGP